METIAIGLWILGGIVAAPLFCWVLVRFISPHPILSHRLWVTSLACLALYALELGSVALLSAVSVRRAIGPAFFPLHALVTLTSPGTLAAALLLGRRHLRRGWGAVAVLGWITGVFAIFYQYDVAESLYGIDGEGGPFSRL